MISGRLLRIAVRDDLKTMPVLVALLLDSGHRLLPDAFAFDLPTLGVRDPLDLGRTVTVLCRSDALKDLQEILAMSGLPLRLDEAQADAGAPWGRLIRHRASTPGPSALRRLQRRRAQRGDDSPLPFLKSEPFACPCVFLHSRTTGQIFPFGLRRETAPAPAATTTAGELTTYPIGQWIPSVLSRPESLSC